jgi:hypothetical protein
MVIPRLTQKLLRLVGAPTIASEASTTILGDWTGGIFYVGHHRYVLLVSEHGRLPVLMPGRDLRNLPRNFPGAIEREVEASSLATITTTNNRSLLGTINDFSFLVSHQLREHPETDLADAALWLSRTPVGPLRHEQPRDVACRLLTSSFFG